MKDNLDNKLDDFSSKIMNEIPLELPSEGFTDAIMSKVINSTAKASEYKPIISNLTWGVIGFIFVFLFAVLFQNDNNTVLFSFDYLSMIDLNTQLFISKLSPQIYLSNIYIYALIITLSLFIGQIVFITKRYIA